MSIRAYIKRLPEKHIPFYVLILTRERNEYKHDKEIKTVTKRIWMDRQATWHMQKAI